MLYKGRLGCCTVGLGAAGEAVGLVLAHKQQHSAAALAVVDIAPARRRLFRRGALTLPVEKALADRVVETQLHLGGDIPAVVEQIVEALLNDVGSSASSRVMALLMTCS